MLVHTGRRFIDGCHFLVQIGAQCFVGDFRFEECSATHFDVHHGGIVETVQQVLEFEIGSAVKFVDAVELGDELDGMGIFDDAMVGDRLGV